MSDARDARDAGKFESTAPRTTCDHEEAFINYTAVRVRREKEIASPDGKGKELDEYKSG
jgi:hypothetical protein